MEFTAKQIAEFIQGRVEGDSDVSVHTFAKIEEGQSGAISFLSNPKYTHYIYDTKSSIVLVNEDVELEHPVKSTLIRVKNAYESVAKLLQLYESTKPKKTGTEEDAHICKSAKIGEDCYIGSFAYIGENVEIGNGCQIDQSAKKLRVWVESQPETVEKKARIMVEHFHENVAHKMGGEARAMIICNGILRAIDYFFSFKELLAKRNSPYKPIIAFSGTKEYNGRHVNEADLNGFPSSAIEKTFRSGNYRFLIVADKFQTGYDEPLLHTMYVDKPLKDVKTVQTLSRLNRCHPLKEETYVLDFMNKTENIQADFQRYYKKTILSHETEVNKLSDKLDVCDQSMIYEEEEVNLFNQKYWSGDPREELDPILDACVERFKQLPVTEDSNKQIEVKSAMKQFVRLYEFLTALMEISRIDWEKKNSFFHFLLRKLPKIEKEDWTEGLLDLVDFDKYRVVRGGDKKIKLENENAVIDPIPVGQGTSTTSDPDLATLEQIIDDFNLVFGDIEWGDPDTVRHQIRQVVTQLQQNDEVRD